MKNLDADKAIARLQKATDKAIPSLLEPLLGRVVYAVLESGGEPTRESLILEAQKQLEAKSPLKPLDPIGKALVVLVKGLQEGSSPKDWLKE